MIVMPGAPGPAGFARPGSGHVRCSVMGIALFFVISAHASWMWSSPRSRNSGETWGHPAFPCLTNYASSSVARACSSVGDDEIQGASPENLLPRVAGNVVYP